MPIFDLHCDSLTKAYDNNYNLISSNKLQVNFNKIKKANYFCQCFAIFINDNNSAPLDYFLKVSAYFLENIKKTSGINLVSRNNFFKSDTTNAVLTLENSNVLENNLDNVKILKDNNVKMTSLCWNNENSVGYPAKYELLGLKKFGFEVVEVLNESNIIIDVSHLSKKGVIDTVRKSKKPIVASHSNSRVICNNVRNLDDESIKLIADSGGVIGLNVYQPFLYEKCEDGYLSLLKHVKHIIKVGGIECLSIGSDFDGIDKVCNINSPKKLMAIDKFFKTSNLTSSIIDKILYKNALRVFKEYS